MASVAQPCSNAKKCPKPKCITTAPRGRKNVNFVNFGICWLHFGKTEWNLRAPASHRGSLRATCVQPAWPAWHRVEACVAPACNLRGLRGTCVELAWPAWRLRGATCVQPACNVRGLRGTCAALFLALASNWRGTAWKKHKKFLFFQFGTMKLQKLQKTHKKNRKTIVVHTWGFCGLHRLHFVPKRLGGFAFVPQKTLQRKSSKVGA